ncbi:MAG: hypothetical protein ABUS79_30245, partial [Pseudomonadota bacterium]
MIRRAILSVCAGAGPVGSRFTPRVTVRVPMAVWAVLACGVASGGCGSAGEGSPERPVSVVRNQTAAGPPATAPDEPGFRKDEALLTPAERVGREIWFKATGGNARFHSYVFPQRSGVAIDWYRVLGGPTREERFKTFGVINDPDCCTPGSAGCPAKTMEETY